MSLNVSLPSSPSATFSATVRLSNSEKCWNTMPMPRPRASDGPDKIIVSPCQRISPSLGWINP